MRTFQQIITVLSLVSLQISPCLAAPSLPIVRPFVSPTISYTGPTNDDTHAVMGQWFENLTSSQLENRTHEFYDNINTSGGGIMGHLAISGVVVKVTTKNFPSKPIESFDVLATLYNDTASPGSGSWAAGTNSHQETLTTLSSYTNVMKKTILTANFATCGPIAFTTSDPAYTDWSTYIVATNQDFAGWFCWNPAIPDSHQYGAFSVPGWDFGDLLPGQSTNRLLHFIVIGQDGNPGFFDSSDSRYDPIMTSFNNQSDIFINRSSSLKIGTWIGTPADDDGSDYPRDIYTSADLSNVSVFHNITGDPAVTITTAQFLSSPPSIVINSAGSDGFVRQILQSTTNLVNGSWANIATNLCWPLPITNCWTNATVGGTVNFFRIIQ